MNPDLPNPPSDELEARLTALLLGELTEEDAVTLRQAMEQDARLAALYHRLKQAIEMVRQTAVSPAEQTATQPAPLKLSNERRQRLLAHFKTVAPKQFTSPRRREISWVLPMSIAAAVVAVIGARVLAPSSFSFKERPSAQVDVVENNLRMIEGAK